MTFLKRLEFQTLILTSFLYFLPFLSFSQSIQTKSTDRFLFKNTLYKILYGKQDSVLAFLGVDGKIILNYPVGNFNLTYFIPGNDLPLTHFNTLNPDFAIYPCAKPNEELVITRLDHTVNYINAARQHFPFLQGQGINVSVKEFLFDTTDIDLLLGYKYSKTQLAAIRTHSTIMATMIGGKGNSSPSSIGVAPEVGLSSSSFAPPLPDTGDYYRTNQISIQNHSYGDEIRNEYGPEAYAFDLSAWKDSFLIHVFSSGNLGNMASKSGVYKNIPGYANLTGSFKMSKNTLAIGALDSMDMVEPVSSKGPAYDGRIKPDLVAYGIEGTSGAAALVSGTSALLQQAYKKEHKDSLPPSSLIKALLINSAQDLGAPGPDYSSGFGKLNVWQAVKTATAQRFILGKLNKNQTNHHLIQIPSNINNLKISLVWNEPPSALFSEKAIRNDLDLIVKDSLSGLLFYPFTLSTYAHEDSLSMPASVGSDHLNTVEQIQLNHPGAGWLNLMVNGDLTDADQNYSIVYDWDFNDQMTWTFPLSKDALRAGKSNTLRWISTYADSTTSTIEYSVDSLNWETINSAVDLNNGMERWVAPDINSIIYLRHRIRDQVYYTNCLVIQDLKMQVGFICDDTVATYWNRLPGIDRYRVSFINQGRMTVVQEITDTFFVFEKRPLPFIAVTPVIQEHEGVRFPSLNYSNQGISCYLMQFLGQKLTEIRAKLILSLGTTFGVQNIRIEQNTNRGNTILLNHPNPMVTHLTIEADLESGNNRFVLFLVLKNGKTVQDTIHLYSLGNRIATVYPNPIRPGQTLNILSQGSSSYQIIINDLHGRAIINLKTLSSGAIDFPRLPAGVYFITLVDRGKIVFKEKLVVY